MQWDQSLISFLNDMADRWGTDKVDFRTIRDITVGKNKKVGKTRCVCICDTWDHV